MTANEDLRASESAAAPARPASLPVPAPLTIAADADADLDPWSPNAAQIPGVAYSTPPPPPPPGAIVAAGGPTTTTDAPAEARTQGRTAAPTGTLAADTRRRTPFEPSPNPYPEPKSGWSRAAKLVAAALVATSLGLGAWAVNATSNADTKAARIAELERDLALLRGESTDLATRLGALQTVAEGTVTDAEQKIGAVQTELSTAIADRDAAQAQAGAYAALFPLDLTMVAAADPTGVYVLTVSGTVDVCTGYANPEIACAVESFPPDLTITGDATTGYIAASTWFDPTALVFNGTTYQGTSPVRSDFGDSCDEVVVPTSLVITVAPFSIAPSPVVSGMKALTLAGTVNVSTVEAATCIASSRTVSVTAQLA